MTTMLYVRTTLTIPGAGTAIHVAELEEAGPDVCTLHRMVALTPDDDVAGAAHVQQGQVRVVGNMDTPMPTIPHPNTYDQFPDIEAAHITQADFELLWAQAATVYGELGNR